MDPQQCREIGLVGFIFLKIRLVVCDTGPCKPGNVTQERLRFIYIIAPSLLLPCNPWEFSRTGEENEVRQEVKWVSIQRNGNNDDINKLTSSKLFILSISFNLHNIPEIGTIFIFFL